MHDIPLLPVRRQLHPGESLESLTIRLQTANLYLGQDWTWICRTYSGDRDHWEQPSKAASWQVLSALSGIEGDRLYRATCHAFMPALQLPSDAATTTVVAGAERAALNRTAINRHVLPRSRARYCPRCLAETPYERVLWRMRLTLICVEHDCFLLDACWRCDKKLSAQDVVSGRCPDCKSDLSTAKVTTVRPGDVKMQARLNKWLHAPLVCQQQFPTDWPRQPMGVILELLRGLVDSLVRTIQGDSMQQVQLEARLLAYEVLFDWPHRLHALYNRIAEPKTGRVTTDYGHVYTHWLSKWWQTSDFDFLQRDFDDYLLTDYPAVFEVTRLRRYKQRASLRDRLPYVRYADVEEALRVSKDFVRLAVWHGVISRYEGKSIVGRDELKRVQARWRNGIPLADVIKILQVDHFALPDLRRLFNLASQSTAVPLGDLDAFVVLLSPSARVSIRADISTRLIWLVVHYDVPLGDILVAIRDGEVRAYWNGFDLWRLSIWIEDVERVFQIKL